MGSYTTPDVTKLEKVEDAYCIECGSPLYWGVQGIGMFCNTPSFVRNRKLQKCSRYGLTTNVSLNEDD